MNYMATIFLVLQTCNARRLDGKF